MPHRKATVIEKLFTIFKEFIPMSVVCWKEGYRRETFFQDLFAGITVGLIALPLAMAFAIGSGVTPERGLYTAIIAGFLISLLGGSRVQIGGPTGAFVVIVYAIVQKHGYDGLAIATILAGIMMIAMGFARFGAFLKYIPYPVTIGFTAGIAVVIFSSQINDFFGLCIPAVPAEFIEKWTTYFHFAKNCSPWSLTIAASVLTLIFVLRRLNAKLPGAVIAVMLATVLAIVLDLPIETIESKFTGIPNLLPMPTLPSFSLEKIQAVFPDAITVAMLGAIESLLSAVVADGMTGHRHRSNVELVSQGLANIGSIIFGGIPATGAIARTTANIKMGAKTPMAGMIHAITLLVIMLLFAKVAAKVPLAALAGVLVFVAWNMSELDHFYAILKGQKSDAFLLLTTFLLTVFIDLTVAVSVGVILSAVLFLKKMSDHTSIEICQLLLEENEDEHPEKHDSDILLRKDVPHGVVIFEINGPFFYAMADRLQEALRQLPNKPEFFILRMRKVPAIDATGVQALKDFTNKCRKENILFILSGVQESVAAILHPAGVLEMIGSKHIFRNVNEALAFTKMNKTNKQLAQALPSIS